MSHAPLADRMRLSQISGTRSNVSNSRHLLTYYSHAFGYCQFRSHVETKDSPARIHTRARARAQHTKIYNMSFNRMQRQLRSTVCASISRYLVRCMAACVVRFSRLHNTDRRAMVIAAIRAARARAEISHNPAVEIRVGGVFVRVCFLIGIVCILYPLNMYLYSIFKNRTRL